MAFTTKQIARAIHLGEATIRQWLSRAPHFEIGTIVGQARLYTEKEAMTIMVSAELMRHGLARPFEALPAARPQKPLPTAGARSGRIATTMTNSQLLPIVRSPLSR